LQDAKKKMFLNKKSAPKTPFIPQDQSSVFLFKAQANGRF
jgi:hypothetical protein